MSLVGGRRVARIGREEEQGGNGAAFSSLSFFLSQTCTSYRSGLSIHSLISIEIVLCCSFGRDEIAAGTGWTTTLYYSIKVDGPSPQRFLGCGLSYDDDSVCSERKTLLPARACN